MAEIPTSSHHLTILSCFLTKLQYPQVMPKQASARQRAPDDVSGLKVAFPQVKGKEYLTLLILVIFTAPRSWVTSAQPRQPQAAEFASAVLPQFIITDCTTDWILALPMGPSKARKPSFRFGFSQFPAPYLQQQEQGPITVIAFWNLGPKRYEALVHLIFHMS